MEKATTLRNPRKNPYIGPRAFDLGEQLYGRDAETRDLVSLLCAERIVLLHSPSGAGKTSLIQAALVPRMIERKFYVRPIARVNREPTQLLQAGNCNRYVFSLLSSFESALPEAEQIPEEELAGLTLADYLARRPKPPGVSFELFIFDQFEEVITLNPADQVNKMAFFTQMGRLLSDDTSWALFSIREDFLGALDPYLKYIPDRLTTTFRLDLLGVKTASQALQHPVEAMNVIFEDDAVKHLLNDLRQVQVQRPDGRMEAQLGPYIEPVQLQVVAYRLWASLGPEDCSIGLDDLAALGDVGQALGAYYAQQVETISVQTGVSERSIREWFDRRLISEGSIRSQVRMGADNSEGLANSSVYLLEDAHLIRAEKRGGAIWYELAHDRLIEPVHKDNSAWFAQHLSLFQRQAELWDMQHRPEGLLLRGKELAQAESWAERHRLLPAERDFLKACQQARQQSERERRQIWLMRVLVLVASIAAIAALVFGILASNSNQHAQEQKAIAESASTLAVAQRNEAQRQTFQARVSQLAAQALAYQSRKFDLALLFGAEAYQRQDNYQTRNSLLDTWQYNPRLFSYLRGHKDPVFEVAFSPDGKMLASGSKYNTIILWDVATRQPIGEPLQGHSSYDNVYSVVFSPDSKILASGSQDQTIILWDVATRKPIGEPLIGHHDNVYSVAFSPDGKMLASGGYDKTIILWDVATRQPIGKPLEGHISAVTNVAFSPDGKMLASGSGDSTFILWDVATRQPIGKPLKGHSGSVNSVGFSPDGKTLVSGSSDRNIILWNVATRQPIGEPLKGHSGSVTSVAFSPDGKTLTSGGDDQTIILWDVATRQPIGAPLIGHSDAMSSVAFSPDGKILASGGSDSTIILWDVANRQPIGEPLMGHLDTISSVAFSPDGKMLASGSDDQTIILWDVATRQQIGKPLKGHNDIVTSVAFSPDGKMLASGSYDKTVILWDVAARQPIGEPLKGHSELVLSVAFSPNGKLLASGSKDSTIILWDVTTRQPIDKPLKGNNSSVYSVAFSPDGKMIAAGGYGIILWNAATRQPIGEPLKGHSGSVFSVGFSPDGKMLASGSDDQTTILWDVATRQPLGEPLKAQGSTVYGVAFSPDGKMLASGSSDNAIILWDVATRQPLGEPLKGHNSGVSSVAFSPDGKMLASGSIDRTIILWDVDPASWVARACRGANRNLTSLEWQQFIGKDEPYQKTCPQNP